MLLCEVVCYGKICKMVSKIRSWYGIRYVMVSYRIGWCVMVQCSVVKHGKIWYNCVVWCFIQPMIFPGIVYFQISPSAISNKFHCIDTLGFFSVLFSVSYSSFRSGHSDLVSME